MFTGLIQSLGTLKFIDRYHIQVSYLAHHHSVFQDLELGDSVAVDGVCLTVETLIPEGFIVSVSPETLNRTILASKLQTQEWVNLETSLRVGSKLGGHFVTGHIDGKGRLQESLQTATSWEMSFVAEAAIARYLVPKGSIAINGISLTIAECSSDGTSFKVAVIPHTYDQTNLKRLSVGSWVNLEGDILGKYVDKLLRLGSHHQEMTRGAETGQLEALSLSADFLAEHGYL